ncbi:MAG: TlyA family RNA methyltransferase [Candidatus Margulisbacteria bacterium]|nr:TlyA family RNA methyltransferase [Candidatus Margulisiibacteriota bacterium]
MKKNKLRLDTLLANKKLSPTRTKAQALIMSGNVLVNEQKIDKPGTLVPSDSTIRILVDNCSYVSRGGLKLEGALKEFNYDPKDKIALDIGASTGGFTDCLLQKGAKHVIALDVGHNQIDYKLRSDPRVTVIEKFNARNLSVEALAKLLKNSHLPLVVMDVSFISITKILPALKEVLTEKADIISLIKPQFEAGKDQVEKGGLITDPKVHEEVLNKIKEFSTNLGFTIKGICDSPITGTDGNKEFFIHLQK